MTEQKPLPARLRSILDAPYPRFSDAEMTRRRGQLIEAMTKADVDTLLVCGENRAGGGVVWLTGWPVTTEGYVVFDGKRRDTMFVQYHNHVPLAKRVALETDVQWGGPATLDALVAELQRRGAKRIGIMGPMSAPKQARLATRFELVEMGAAYVRMRLVKSAEEIDWVRIGAWLSDRAIHALKDSMRSGMSERELWRITEDAYVGEGGITAIHYFGTTPMADPKLCVPAQYASSRRIAAGDVVFTEISAAFWDYPGQVLRSFAIEAEPTPLYRDLYDTAERALDSILGVIRAGATLESLVAASADIEKAGFTTCDDLVHGYVGGYGPPVLGSRSRPAGPIPDERLETGMMLVVQPNVVTLDGRAGVQVGELIAVTETGFERMHAAPRGFMRAG
jgi:Xaa-Pro aminopeptidase